MRTPSTNSQAREGIKVAMATRAVESYDRSPRHYDQQPPGDGACHAPHRVKVQVSIYLKQQQQTEDKRREVRAVPKSKTAATAANMPQQLRWASALAALRSAHRASV
jgi:hypothetical protein